MARAGAHALRCLIPHRRCTAGQVTGDRTLTLLVMRCDRGQGLALQVA